MWQTLAFKMAQVLYKHVLRRLICEKITDPDSEWDDRAMKALDGIFK
jgi:hypothetical protein